MIRALLSAVLALALVAQPVLAQQVIPGGGGGGGTTAPGGTSGQIQYNNSGAFGGVATTGSGNVVLATSPTLVTPALGTPASGVLTNTSGYAVVASTSVPGVVKVDGTSITITGGVISASAGGTGCTVAGTANQIVSNNGSTGCQASAATATTGGTIVIPTGQTLGLTGSSTGVDSLTTANAGASNHTITIPSATDTLVNLAGTQTLTNKSIATTELTGTLKSEYMWTVPSNVTVANGTTVIEVNFPWTSGTITSVDYGTNGGTPSFVASVQIGGTPVTSCTSLTVTSSTNTNVACTGAQTLASGNTVTVVITSTSGTPDQSWVKVNFTHSVS